MNPVASLHRRPARASHPASAGISSRTRSEAYFSKPSLPMREYVAELNERLQRHPMYLEGMHFPEPQPGSTPMLAAALAWEGSWDCMGVFSSVAEDVARDYDLAPAERFTMEMHT